MASLDSLLAARLPLPPAVAVFYVVFKPIVAGAYDALEHARSSLLDARSSLLDTPLTSVNISPDPLLYVFRLGNHSESPLNTLCFDGLALVHSSSFAPPAVSSILPDPHLRVLLSHFYEAVRSRLLSDIVVSPASKSRSIKRFNDGFLIGQPSSSSDWEYKSMSRPLVFCHLQVHFSYSSAGIPTHLLVHPILLPTPFLDLPPSLPLPAGTPITLLPYGTPAYFLATYAGPTAGLTKQFQSSLKGLGAGDWDTAAETPSFILGWIKVENKQGEDKGITIIYPTKLCLSSISSSSSRAPLHYIPDLPAPLQPSPQAAPALPSITHQSTPRPSLFSSPTSESLHAFRALNLSKSNDLRHVAVEVGGYVDAVARERERERERLKRERESSAGGSPKLSRTPATAPTPMSVETTSAIAAAPPTSNAVAGPSTVPPLVPPPPQMQPSLSMQIQNFYPSPPQTVPHTAAPSDGKTSPTIENGTAAEELVEAPLVGSADTAPPSAEPVPPPSQANGGYDPYESSAWTAQPADDAYLGMSMDMDMDFGMDLGMGMDFGSLMASSSSNNNATSTTSTGATASGGASSYAQNRGGMEFDDAFTDDDFSFFDRPARTHAHTHSRNVSGSGTHAHFGSGMSPPAPHTHHFGATDNASSTHNGQIWTPGAFLDSLTTPHATGGGEHTDEAPPDLLPSSPGQTPAESQSMSAPATPTAGVHLAPEPEVVIRRSGSAGSSRFEPIPFAPYHRAADGKYVAGKFALPSPPAEDDAERFSPDTYPFVLPPPSSASTSTSTSSTLMSALSLPASPVAHALAGWRRRYDAQTDPRIGVVRKLIGVKRKAPAHPGQMARDPPKTSPWIRAHEDWEMPGPVPPDETGEKEVESEEDEEEDVEEEDVDSPMLSRPTTPSPAYLPLGPSLLHAQFQHAHLLPLSSPLRPPGAAVAPQSLGPGPSHSNASASVPTPVSPAATMGAANERSKSLEMAAAAVAAEVVDNPIWAETWRATAGGGAKPTRGVWAADYKTVAQLLQAVPGLEAPVSVADLFELDGTKLMEALDAPMISIGKGDAVIQVLPTALRFWEKLGLDPKGGKKDVSAFVLFEDDAGEQRQTLVETWLTNVCNSYQGKHFGRMNSGNSNVCAKDGLVPLRFDASFRKSLASFVSSLTSSQPTVIVFIILPIVAMSLSSPVLRQILSVATKIFNNHRSSQLSLQFIPEQHLFSALERSSSSHDSSLEQLSLSIYNRLRVPVDRLRTCRPTWPPLAPNPDDIRGHFSAPSFTLARPWYNKVSYVRAARPSLDVLDRHTLLHVGYHLTSCGRWIIACAVDQRGETHEVGVWLTRGAAPGEQDGGEIEVTEEEDAVQRVWDFGMQLARKANVEWRVVFARLGVMGEKELNAWMSHLNEQVVSSRTQPPLHHTLVSVVPDSSWSFISKSSAPTSPVPRPSPPGRSPSASKQTWIFTDVSSTTYALFPKNHIPISIPPSQSDFGLSQSFIPEPPSTAPLSPHLHNSSQPTTPIIPLDVSFLQTLVSTPTTTLPHPISLLPQCSSILVRVPHTSSASAVTMNHIHLLHTFHSASYTHSLQSSSSSSACVPDDRCLLNDLTRNFHDLAILAQIRCKLDGAGGHKGLPFHLAAVDAMSMALDRDWDHLETGTEV